MTWAAGTAGKLLPGSKRCLEGGGVKLTVSIIRLQTFIKRARVVYYGAHVVGNKSLPAAKQHRLPFRFHCPSECGVLITHGRRKAKRRQLARNVLPPKQLPENGLKRRLRTHLPRPHVEPNRRKLAVNEQPPQADQRGKMVPRLSGWMGPAKGGGGRVHRPLYTTHGGNDDDVCWKH